ncbi:MAG TPA: penicillin-binding protein activator [Candidatus Saccharimonadales bacterium]|nr:penicillin-binding protein activator [Candidatus Saccharimonadales bacterium]
MDLKVQGGSARLSEFPELDNQTPIPQPPKKGLSRIFIVNTVLALLLLAVCAYGVFMYYQSTRSPEKPRIKVGVMMAFSGGSSSMGYGAMKGVQLAKKQLSADNIEIIQEDSKCDPKSAAEAVKRLIEQKVAAIIGEGCSSATVAALPAANNARVPLISPSASSPTLTIPNDYFFRVVPPDNFQGAFMAQSIYDRGIRNVGVFYTNEPYGTGMNTVFREKFEALGGKVVATASAEPDVIDLTAQINDLKAAKPQAVFVAPNSVVTATAVVKLSRQAGLAVPLFGADIMYDNTMINNAMSAAEGLIISSFPTGTKAFKQSLLNEYQKSEQLYAAPQAYDIIHLLQIATEQGASTGEEIKQAIPGISFQGVSGLIKFDSNGEVTNRDYRYDLFEVKDGAFQLVAQ